VEGAGHLGVDRSVPSCGPVWVGSPGGGNPKGRTNLIGLAELILTGGWYIWWEHRQYVHGENIQRPSRSALSIAALTKNYKLAMKKGAKVRKGWQKPPEGMIMVNVDASFDDDVGRGSTGVVIRDHSRGGDGCRA